jgi:hypothetical protein
LNNKKYEELQELQELQERIDVYEKILCFEDNIFNYENEGESTRK